MTDGIIQQTIKRHGQEGDLHWNILMELEQELIEKIKQASIDRKNELTKIGYCLRQEEVDNLEKILIGDNKE